jgi:hypothetical protein
VEREKQAVCTLLGAVILLLVGGCHVLPYELTTTSQSGYTVNLREAKKELVEIAPIGQTVGLSVLKENQVLFEKQDWFDDDSARFEDVCPEHDWISDSITRFGRKPGHRSPEFDELIIRNDSGQAVDYLEVRVDKYEIFLAMGLQPDMEEKVFVERPLGGAWERYFHLSIKLAGSQEVKSSLSVSKLSLGNVESVRYCLSVKDASVNVCDKAVGN